MYRVLPTLGPVLVVSFCNSPVSETCRDHACHHLGLFDFQPCLCDYSIFKSLAAVLDPIKSGNHSRLSYRGPNYDGPAANTPTNRQC